jgi:transcriptional regulator with XRE-family HTH domain
MKKETKRFDFKPIGRAVKAVRESRGLTREQLAEVMELALRYIMSIENKGQHPSFQVFYKLVSMFDISVDRYLFPDSPAERSTRRRQLDGLLDSLDEKDYMILEATARGIMQAKTAGEA